MRGSAPYDELDEGTLCNSVLCRERAASTASTATSSELENALTVDYRLGMGCAVSGPLPPHNTPVPHPPPLRVHAERACAAHAPTTTARVLTHPLQREAKQAQLEARATRREGR